MSDSLAPTSPRAIIERYYGALNCHDVSALERIVASDVRTHDGREENGLASFQQTLTDYAFAFPDFHHQVEDILVDGDRVAARVLSTGTHLGTFLGHPPTQRRFVAPSITVFRLAAGVIQELWNVFDTINMLSQIGLYSPMPSTAKAVVNEDSSMKDSPSESGSAQPSRSHTPPGPTTAFSLSDVRKDALGFLRKLQSEHGDVVRYNCDGRSSVFINHPRGIKQVLHDNAANYSKLGTADLQLLQPMLGEGLLTTEGEVWRRARQLLQPQFTPRQVSQSTETIVRVCRQMLERWRQDSAGDGILDVVHEMSRLTLEIAGQVFFSFDLASQSESFGHMVAVLNECMGAAHPNTPAIRERFSRTITAVRSVVWQPFAARQFYDTRERDVVSLLLRAQQESGLSNAAVLDQAVTILLAGHETTAKGLSWALAMLARHPDLRKQACAEVDSIFPRRDLGVTDLPSLKLIRALIDESLRLYPPVWLISRSALSGDTLEGFAIEPGTLIVISPYLIHRHPDHWPHPDKFLPQRFLECEAEHHTQAYRYLPFSVGPRHCVGKHFALLEMVLVLGTICSDVELELSADHSLEIETLVTLRPRHGLPMRLRRRQLESNRRSNDE